MTQVRHLKPADVPEKEQMITLLNQLLESVKSGEVIALATIGLRIGDNYQEAVVMPKGTRLAVAGGLDLLKTRILINVIEEHDLV